LTRSRPGRGRGCGDPEVWLFGGGHVGRALTRALLLLPVKVHVAETRADELDLTPEGATRHLSALPESLVAGIAPGSVIIVLTHDHALDFLIVSAALARDDLAQVGMIGSDTKRATFEHQLSAKAATRIAFKLICPIGRKIADKRPEAIAATVLPRSLQHLRTGGTARLSQRPEAPAPRRAMRWRWRRHWCCRQ
jgi:xanthine dehydrogenase accessory factor